MRRLFVALLRQMVLLPSLVLVGLVRGLKWLIAPLALSLQMLLGVPLALLKVRQPRRAQFVPVAEAELPDATWVHFSDTAQALTAEGFNPCGDFRCDGLVHQATFWLRVLVHPTPGMRALAVQITGAHRSGFLTQCVEFTTEFSDDRVLVLNNLNRAYGLPTPPYLARMQLKDVWDPRALYTLHRQLVSALGQSVDRVHISHLDPDPDPIHWLNRSYQREVEALLAQGWLRPDPTAKDQLRLTWKGAWLSTWRQAWPLASLYLRAADRRARRLLKHHGLRPAAFTGAAPGIVVARQLLPEPVLVTTVRGGYSLILPLAQQTEPDAVLEAVTVELDCDDTDQLLLLEFRYSFRSTTDTPQRRIRRGHGFDILLVPDAGALAVTAMERDVEQATDDSEWTELTATSTLVPLSLGPWLHDLDRILPTALAALTTQAGTSSLQPDSAALYGNEDGAPYWQVVAWHSATDSPLHVMLDARSGALLPGTRTPSPGAPTVTD